MDTRRFFTTNDEALIIEAIRAAELRTSGEIRLHVNDEHKGDFDTFAKMIFDKLQIQNTAQRNGILFYLAIETKRFAILGDIGIHAKVNDEFWHTLATELEQEFRKNNYCQGLINAISKCGELLQEHFPTLADNPNELSNDISYE